MHGTHTRARSLGSRRAATAVEYGVLMLIVAGVYLTSLAWLGSQLEPAVYPDGIDDPAAAATADMVRQFKCILTGFGAHQPGTPPGQNKDGTPPCENPTKGGN